MKNTSQSYHVNNDELSIKDFVVFARSLYRLLLRNWVLLVFSILIFGLCGFIFATIMPIKYNSELRFLVKNEASVSGIGGMLGGLGTMLTGSTMGSPLERTIEIASSDRIVGSALLETVEFEGRKEILANCLIRINNLHRKWESDTALKNVNFTNKDTLIESMSFSKRKALKKMQEFLIPKDGKGIITRTFDKKSGVVTLSAIHKNEEFAIVLTKEIFNKLRDFYVEQMISSAANNVQILEQKVDSIKFELSRVQSLYARGSDQSFGLLFQEDKVHLKKLAIKEQILLAMYAEAQKNLETFKFMNDSAIPSLTVIDMPYSPLKEVKYNKLIFSTIGMMLGIFFVVTFLLIRIWYKNPTIN
jgi:hypothetical protein